MAGWDGTSPTKDEQNAAARLLMENALTSGNGELLKATKVLMDARDAALAEWAATKGGE